MASKPSLTLDPGESVVQSGHFTRTVEGRESTAMTKDDPNNEASSESRPTAKKAKGGIDVVEATDDRLVERLRERFGDAIHSAVIMVGQRVVVVAVDSLAEVLTYLKSGDELKFDLLLDVTAVHRPAETPPFELVYQLCSTSTLERVRIKSGIEDGASAQSVTGIWRTANWLERECFDMFGIVFEGHPDLRRILLPEGWEGHPLRKEYPVEFRENRWVADTLNIHALPDDADFSGKVEI